LGFTRYSFTSRLLCTNQSSFYCHPPLAMPTLLQYCCTTVAQDTTPPPTPLSYAIHYTISVLAISCKGQPAFGATVRCTARRSNKLCLCIHSLLITGIIIASTNCGNAHLQVLNTHSIYSHRLFIRSCMYVLFICICICMRVNLANAPAVAATGTSTSASRSYIIIILTCLL